MMKCGIFFSVVLLLFGNLTSPNGSVVPVAANVSAVAVLAWIAAKYASEIKELRNKLDDVVEKIRTKMDEIAEKIRISHEQSMSSFQSQCLEREDRHLNKIMELVERVCKCKHTIDT